MIDNTDRHIKIPATVGTFANSLYSLYELLKFWCTTTFQSLTCDESVQGFLVNSSESYNTWICFVLFLAVSREVFERSACNNISTPNNTVNSGSNEVTSRPDDNLLVGNIPSNVSYMQNISSTQSESYISGDGTILYTEASSTVTPTLLRRENRPFEIGMMTIFLKCCADMCFDHKSKKIQTITLRTKWYFFTHSQFFMIKIVSLKLFEFSNNLFHSRLWDI